MKISDLINATPLEQESMVFSEAALLAALRDSEEAVAREIRRLASDARWSASRWKPVRKAAIAAKRAVSLHRAAFRYWAFARQPEKAQESKKAAILVEARIAEILGLTESLCAPTGAQVEQLVDELANMVATATADLEAAKAARKALIKAEAAARAAAIAEQARRQREAAAARRAVTATPKSVADVAQETLQRVPGTVRHAVRQLLAGKELPSGLSQAEVRLALALAKVLSQK